MQTRRGYVVATFGFIGMLMLALLVGGGQRVSASEHGTPPADEANMGDCVEALGIGEEGNACVIVIHASPDAPAVDVYVNGEMALGDLEFGADSGWVALPAGDHQIQVTAAGAELDTAVIDAEVTLDEGAAYEIAATGMLDEIEPQIYQADLSAVGTDDDPMARIRVIHASPDAPNVDIAVMDGDVLIDDLAFPDASDYLMVPADSYDLEVRVADTTDVALELPGVMLDGGMAYSVYAIGLVEDETLSVIVIPAATESDLHGADH